MDLRITPQTILARAISQTSQQTARLGKLQEQASTGKKVLLPSDDPSRLGSLLRSKGQDQRLETFLVNLREGRSSLDLSVSLLTQAGDVLKQARNLAVEGSQSTNDAQAHEAMAQEVDRLLERLIEVTNSQHNGRFLFSGTASTQRPFQFTGTDSQGRPTGVIYQGAGARDAILVSSQQTIPTLYSGQEVFQVSERSATVFRGATGAAAGSGTDSATGSGNLLVRHTATTFAPGSGVQAGASSAAADTILGPAGAHVLTINDTSGTGASGTISLNGGPPVAFTNANTDLVVPGPRGELVHLNTTAITPAFNGAVALTAAGTLSVDGGATSVAIDFSANQQIINGGTGAVTNVSSTNIRSTGTDQLEYSGTSDVFQTLIALRDDLRNTRGLTSPEQLQSISRRIADLDRVRDGVLSTVGEQAADLKTLEDLETHLQDLQLTTRKLISELEDIDITQVVLELQGQQNLLEMTLGATARVMSISLLDFLR